MRCQSAGVAKTNMFLNPSKDFRFRSFVSNETKRVIWVSNIYSFNIERLVRVEVVGGFCSSPPSPYFWPKTGRKLPKKVVDTEMIFVRSFFALKHE